MATFTIENNGSSVNSALQKNDAKILNGWSMYDWANSVYSLVITSSIFPIFYENSTPDVVSFFGFNLRNTTLYSYSLSAAFLIIAVISPLLSGIADYSGRKKFFMQLFCYLGAISCCGLFFFSSSHLELGILLVMLAAIGYSGSLVFYNSFLPEIATPDRQDAVSARGFAFGYAGSIILLVINLTMIMYPQWYGMEGGAMPAKITFVTVGLWWAGFAQFTFKRLPDNVYHRKPKDQVIYKGYLELKAVWQELKKSVRLKKYLLAFFVFNMGVQTVMYMAVLFAKNEIIGMPDDGLIISILIIQVIAIFGAYLFSYLSRSLGNLRALLIAVFVWLLVCFIAFKITLPWEFYILAAIVGGVMGGIQALSRSTYSKFLPETTIDHASYFSFYDVCDKLGLVIGTLTFGIVNEFTGSLRFSALTLGIFFLLGLILLFLVPKKETGFITGVEG